MDVQPRNPSVKGPDKWFTGLVWIDPITPLPEGDAQLNIGVVHFTPGARTAWHSHAGGQTLYVTDGRGLVQTRGEHAVDLRPGDVHHTPDGHEHWHGATRDHLMTHISITQGPASWGEHVTDDEYGKATETDRS